MCLKICKIFIFLCVLIYCTSCAGREKVIYKDVYIPQKCKVETPSRPVNQAGAVINNVLIIEYALKLEQALKACKGGDI